MKDYHHCWHYLKVFLCTVLIIAITKLGGISLTQIINIYKVSSAAYAQQSSPSPVICSHPSQQQGFLTVKTIIQDPNHIVKVPIDTLLFRVVVRDNGESSTFNLRVSNPLTLCLSPGDFTLKQINASRGFKFDPPTYSLSGGSTKTNTPCYGKISAGNQFDCTITNSVTSIIAPTSGNNGTTLSVFGLASTNIKPDKVIVLLGVETTNKTSDAASLANSKLMNRVLSALKATGVKENETSTASFAINPNYLQGTRANITGFTVTNLIKLESSNTTSVAKWIDRSIKAGANRINSIDFSISDKKLDDTRDALVKNAISDAQRKANNTASTLGLKVIGVKSISLDPLESGRPPSPQLGTAQGLSGSRLNVSPIIPGEQQISETVSIVFVLGK